MDKNEHEIFLDLQINLFSILLPAIREHSCSFVAETPFLKCYIELGEEEIV